MDIKIIQTKGKRPQVVLDISLFISIISPEKAKDIQNFKQIEEVFHQQTKTEINEDPTFYHTFEEWMNALFIIDQRDPKEILLDYGMTLEEYRKQIWEAEKNLQDVMSYASFKKKWKKIKSVK
jgi:hypothetical protein